MNEYILTHIEEYRKKGITTTKSVEIKDMIVEYLKRKGEKCKWRWNGYSEYVIEPLNLQNNKFYATLKMKKGDEK